MSQVAPSWSGGGSTGRPLAFVDIAAAGLAAVSCVQNSSCLAYIGSVGVSVSWRVRRSSRRRALLAEGKRHGAYVRQQLWDHGGLDLTRKERVTVDDVALCSCELDGTMERG